MSDQGVKVVELPSESDKSGERRAAGLTCTGKTPHKIKWISIRNPKTRPRVRSR
jgi:hypothetical protein